MKIRTLEYHDKRFDWHLNPVDFSGNNLTLLVGVSGVGKTLILESIMKLKVIAGGASLNGVKWNVTFSAENGLTYCWEGEFETKKDGVNKTEKSKIVYEKLTSDQSVIVERKFSDIILKGKETPKLSPFQSVITMLNQEDVISPVCKALKNITYSGLPDPESDVNPDEGSRIAYHMNYSESMTTYNSLKDIRDSGFHSHIKLLLCYKKDPETFEKIKQHFIAIFPYTEDIKVEPDRIYKTVSQEYFIKSAHKEDIKKEDIKKEAIRLEKDYVSFRIQIKEKG